MNIIAIKGYRLQKSLFSPACLLTNIARIANAVRVTLWLLVTNPQWQVFRKLKTKYKSSQLFEKHCSCRRPFCSLHPDLYVLWPDTIFCYNLGGSSSSIVLSNFLLWSLGGQVYNILTNLMKSSRTIYFFLTWWRAACQEGKSESGHISLSASPQLRSP